MARRLTLNLGLRLQRTYGWVPAVCQPATLFIAGQCFDKIDDVPDYLDLAPRFAMIYDLAGDGKTALKLPVNRDNDVLGAADASRINPMRATSDSRTWTDRNGDLVPQLTELGPSTGFNLGTTNRYADDLERPYVNTITGGIERQLFADSVLAINYIHRQTRRQIGSRNVAVPRDSYVPIIVTERGSGERVTVYKPGALAARPLRHGVRQRARARRQPWTRQYLETLVHAFHGFDVTFTKRLKDRWMVISGISYGHNVGDVYDTADLNNPSFTFRQGVIGFDVPCRSRVRACMNCRTVSG